MDKYTLFRCAGPVCKGVDEKRKMKEEKIGGVDLCHCTRALYQLYHYSSLFLALAKREVVKYSQFCLLIQDCIEFR